MSPVLDGVRPGGKPIVIQLNDEDDERVKELGGIVLDNGAPVVGARIGYWSRNRSESIRDSQVKTDDAGRFVLDNLPDGGGLLYVFASSDTFVAARSEPVALPLGEPLDEVVVLPVTGVDFEVTVVDEEGQAVPRAAVSLSHVGTPPLQIYGTTDASGGVVFPRLPLSRYQLSIESADGRFFLRDVLDWDGGRDPPVLTVRPARR